MLDYVQCKIPHTPYESTYTYSCKSINKQDLLLDHVHVYVCTLCHERIELRT